MTNLTADAFNFDALKEQLGTDPFAQATNKYAEDNRFYKLPKDKDGNGGAIIRFLPDSHNNLIKQIFRINSTIIKNDKKRFVNELSPQTIGAPCPFQEEWQRLWNSGDKEGAKTFGRSMKYITNIKVLKDPVNPENEGKIFLFEMSGSMKSKIEEALNPSEQDRALGAQPKELFNPLRGNSFKLASKRGSNGFINYDSSAVIDTVDSIYDSVEAALEDIKSNTYDLSDFDKIEAYLPYEELQKKFKWVTFTDNETPSAQAAQSAQVAQVAQPVVATAATAEVTPVQAGSVAADSLAAVSGNSTQVETTPAQPAAKSDELDQLLAGLV